MKIIASDYDGTVNYNGGVSENDRKAIERFRSEGNKFGIVTGRDLELSAWIRQGDGFEYDFIISCTGAVIRDGDGNIIYVKKGKTGDFIHKIIEKALELKCNYFSISNLFNKTCLDITAHMPIDLSFLQEFTQANSNFPTEEAAIEFCEFVTSNFADRISVYRNGRNVDMPPPNTSKVSGIYEYAKMYENPQIYTVGDNENDILMIKEFYGFAVSNAVDSVKKLAKGHCDRICDMIEYILKEK